MARPAGTKVVKCVEKKCDGRLVAAIGAIGTCSKCGAKVKFTQKLMKELGKL